MSETLERLKAALAGREVALKVLRPEFTAILVGERFLKKIRLTHSFPWLT